MHNTMHFPLDTNGAVKSFLVAEEYKNINNFLTMINSMSNNEPFFSMKIIVHVLIYLYSAQRN